MKKITVLLTIVSILVVLRLLAVSGSNEKYYYQMAIDEIDRDIRAVVKKDWSWEQKLDYYSERFLNAPYELNCEGEGEHAKYEKWPLLNLKQVNCMTYCEIVIALALSDYYEEFFNVLQHIRYRAGIIGMATRNHYTMVDWLPANAWCLDDISAQIGGTDVAQLTRTISHQTFFAGKGIHDIPIYLPDREVTIDYVPLKKLAAHQALLKTGDIVALIQNREGIFSAHMLLIIKKDEQIYFRHASMAEGKVVDTPFDEYIEGVAQKPRYLGMSLMRLKNNIQWRDGVYTHGKFICRLGEE